MIKNFKILTFCILSYSIFIESNVYQIARDLKNSNIINNNFKNITLENIITYAKNRNLNIIKQCFDNISKDKAYDLLNQKDENGNNFFHYLFKYNNINTELFKYFIDKIKEKFKNNQDNQRKKIKPSLIEFFNCNNSYFHENSPLFIALKSKQFDCCQLMVEECQDLLDLKDNPNPQIKYNNFFDYIDKNIEPNNKHPFYYQNNDIFMHIAMFANKDFIQYIINKIKQKLGEDKFKEKTKNYINEHAAMLASAVNNDLEVIKIIIKESNFNIEEERDNEEGMFENYIQINKNKNILKNFNLTYDISYLLDLSLEKKYFNLFMELLGDKNHFEGLVTKLIINNKEETLYFNNFIINLIRDKEYNIIEKIFDKYQDSDLLFSLLLEKELYNDDDEPYAILSYTILSQAIIDYIDKKDNEESYKTYIPFLRYILDHEVKAIDIFTKYPKFFDNIGIEDIYEQIVLLLKNKKISNEQKLKIFEYITNDNNKNNNIFIKILGNENNFKNLINNYILNPNKEISLFSAYIGNLIEKGKNDIIEQIFNQYKDSNILFLSILQEEILKNKYTPLLRAILKDIDKKNNEAIKAIDIFINNSKFFENIKIEDIHGQIALIFKNEEISNEYKLKILKYITDIENKITKNYKNFNINGEKYSRHKYKFNALDSFNNQQVVIKNNIGTIIHFLKSIARYNYNIKDIIDILFIIENNNEKLYENINKYLVEVLKSFHKFCILNIRENMDDNKIIELLNKKFVIIALLITFYNNIDIDLNQTINKIHQEMTRNMYIDNTTQTYLDQFYNLLNTLINNIHVYNKTLFYNFDLYLKNGDILSNYILNNLHKLFNEIFYILVSPIIINSKIFNNSKNTIDLNKIESYIKKIEVNNIIKKLFVLNIYSFLPKFIPSVNSQYRKNIIENYKDQNEIISLGKIDNISDQAIYKILSDHNQINQIFNLEKLEIIEQTSQLTKNNIEKINIKDTSLDIVFNTFAEKILKTFQEYSSNNEYKSFIKNTFKHLKTLSHQYIINRISKYCNYFVYYNPKNKSNNISEEPNYFLTNIIKDKDDLRYQQEVINFDISDEYINNLNIKITNFNNYNLDQKSSKDLNKLNSLNKIISKLNQYKGIFIKFNNKDRFKELGKIAFNLHHNNQSSSKNNQNINQLKSKIIEFIKSNINLNSVDETHNFIKNNILFINNENCLLIVLPKIAEKITENDNLLNLLNTLLRILFIKNNNNQNYNLDKFVLKNYFFSDFNNSNNLILKYEIKQ